MNKYVTYACASCNNDEGWIGVGPCRACGSNEYVMKVDGELRNASEGTQRRINACIVTLWAPIAFVVVLCVVYAFVMAYLVSV